VRQRRRSPCSAATSDPSTRFRTLHYRAFSLPFRVHSRHICWAHGRFCQYSSFFLFLPHQCTQTLLLYLPSFGPPLPFSGSVVSCLILLPRYRFKQVFPRIPHFSRYMFTIRTMGLMLSRNRVCYTGHFFFLFSLAIPSFFEAGFAQSVVKHRRAPIRLMPRRLVPNAHGSCRPGLACR